MNLDLQDDHGFLRPDSRVLRGNLHPWWRGRDRRCKAGRADPPARKNAFIGAFRVPRNVAAELGNLSVTGAF